jgi:ABC-type oligopeptide transport system substrate-binding subunit
MRKTLSMLALLTGCGLLAASALGSVSQSPPANTLRWSLSVDIDHVDPALAYYTPSWALEYATGAMLFNYPDAPAPRGARLVPEVAAGFPAITRDGRTYTFRLRTAYRFSDGRRVRAANFVRAFQRARSPWLVTPAARFISDVVDFAALDPYHLRIRLRKPAGDLLARLAMPFFMAVPADTPAVVDGIGAPVASAGPYFIREWTKTRRIVLERNRYYRGPRPHRVSLIRVDIGLPLETIKLNIDSGRADTGDIPAAAHAELGDRFGVRRRSPGRYFANPTPTILYLAFNHDRPLFGGPTRLGNLRLKKAINLAIDRQALMNQYGAHAGTVHDQLLPPTIRGFRDVSIYPRRPDLGRARALAEGALRSSIQGTLYCTSRSPSPQVCQLVQSNLRAIGLNIDVRLYRSCFPPCGPSRRGEPFDLSLERRQMDYFDPSNFALLIDGRTIRATDNMNVSYFNSPAYNRKVARAARLSGPPRYRAFSALDHDLMRKAAPIAVYGVSNDRHYVSARTGCYFHHPVYGFDFPAICLRAG